MAKAAPGGGTLREGGLFFGDEKFFLKKWNGRSCAVWRNSRAPVVQPPRSSQTPIADDSRYKRVNSANLAHGFPAFDDLQNDIEVYPLPIKF